MNDERRRRDEKPSTTGAAAMVAIPVVMVICCAAGPAVLAAIVGGVTAWFADLGVVGALAVAAVVGILVYSGWRLHQSRSARNPDTVSPTQSH